MVNYYDEISEGYEELHKEEQLKKVEFISEYVQVKPSDKLLDVGCGTGLTTERWNCVRYGLDPAKKLIEKGKKLRKDINFILGEAENIQFPDKTFDFVISITAIQNFHDIEKGLKEIKRVGKKRFILSFLKKSTKKEYISDLINKLFDVKEILEEDKDLFFVI
jgi:ubiquinone/menaquinone biosynthesis C-methylase UbiE